MYQFSPTWRNVRKLLHIQVSVIFPYPFMKKIQKHFVFECSDEILDLEQKQRKSTS